MPIEAQNENRMGTEKMFPLIISMSLPAMFSMLIQALYNIVDSYFVAQVSEKAVSALSLAYPIQNLLIAFAVGTAAGVLVPVAWVLAKVTNDVGMVWWAFPIAEAVSLAVSMMFFTHLYKTELKNGKDIP